MHGWKRAAFVALMVIFCLSAGLARAESILRLEHESAQPKKNASSVHGPAFARETEFERQNKQKVAHFTSSPKKKKEAVQWGDKHAKGFKLAPKPPRTLIDNGAVPILAVLEPTSAMAASGVEMAAAVPVPSALWAGLGLMGVLGARRWLGNGRVCG